MYIIKLNAIDSTNDYLKMLNIKKTPKDFTVVVAENQTNGRGQMGAIWNTEQGKNLTFSIFKAVLFLNVTNQFYISMSVALGVISALKELQIPKLNIKWPNDILAEQKKIAGILIENVIKNNRLESSIIGIGLNVNQKFFKNLPQASSLYNLKGVIYNKDEVLSSVLKHIEKQLHRLKKGELNDIKAEYEASLFRIKKPSTFKSSTQQNFSGFIEGVTDDGKLKVRLEDNIFKVYDLKEIQLLY